MKNNFAKIIKSYKRAFTIIELLISLIIFWVWLLVVLSALNRNVLLLNQIQLKTKATLLAKDRLTIFYNFRDSNNIKYRQWNYITWAVWAEEFFTTWSNYKVWTVLSWNKNQIEKITDTSFDKTRFYYKTWSILNSVNKEVYSGFYYTYENTWKKTPFAWYISLSWVYLKPEMWWNKNIFKVYSIVKYKKSSFTGEIILESFVTNWK